tara:strand:+ start:2543 stop:3241 length:699 start_codon:yes stop_codon:yes gene_type:complete
MLKIVSFKICPFVQRVTALLDAKEVGYEIEYISLSDKPDWFLALSPNGQVPLLITESGQGLFESEAIVEYIDERYPLLDADASLEQRALNRAWSYLAAKHYLVQCSTLRSSDQQTLSERQQGLAVAFRKIEQALANGPYFNGDKLSNVDIAWLPLLHRADIIQRHSGHDLLEGFPKLQLWQQSLLKTGLAETSVSSDFEARFTEFYLSDKTYLGNPERVESAPDLCANDRCC